MHHCEQHLAGPRAIRHVYLTSPAAPLWCRTLPCRAVQVKGEGAGDTTNVTRSGYDEENAKSKVGA